MLDKEWLVVMALAVSLSFIFSSIINTKSHYLYSRWKHALKQFEHTERLIEDQFPQPEGTVLVVGMGRVGTGAYDSLRDNLGKRVCGVDVDELRVIAHCNVGRNVIQADTEDPEFWEHIDLSKIELIMLTIPTHEDIVETTKQLKHVVYRGKVSAIAHYEDEKKLLLAAGVDVVFNFYTNAGAGLAESSVHLFDKDSITANS